MFTTSALRRSIRTFLAMLVAAVSLITGLRPEFAYAAPRPVRSCAADTSAAGLTAYFASGAAPVRADYQRVLQLPGGRALWTFQDAFVAGRAGHPILVHNAALLQTGNCFQLLRGGSTAAPRPWLFADRTTPYRHWFWPLAAEIGTDGNIHVFFAEMRLHGNHYLSDRTEPVATWLATLRMADLQLLDVHPASNSSASLYGWSVTSDDHWTYLYAHCYRQFGWGTALGYDATCSADVQVGRVARGHLDDRPTYWDGTTWQTDPNAAVPVIPRTGRAVNATQVRWDGRRFIAITKEGDWWGSTVYVDAARNAQGPWTTIRTYRVEPICADCNTYFASFVPTDHTARSMTVAISNNRWDGAASNSYRPTFLDLSTTLQHAGH